MYLSLALASYNLYGKMINNNVYPARKKIAIKQTERMEMRGIFFRWLILTGAIVVASYLFDGIHVSGFFSAFFAAALLGVLNAVFRPIVFILTLPLTVLTLGLFTFVINAVMLQMASGVIPGFEVKGFWTAVFGSLVISVVSWLASSFINDRGTVEFIELHHKGDNRWG